jgi:hypothetical protein
VGFGDLKRISDDWHADWTWEWQTTAIPVINTKGDSRHKQEAYDE